MKILTGKQPAIHEFHQAVNHITGSVSRGLLIRFDKSISFLAQVQEFCFDRAWGEMFSGPFTQTTNSLRKAAFVRGLISLPHFLTDEPEGVRRFLLGALTDAQKGMQETKDDGDVGKQGQPGLFGGQPAIQVDAVGLVVRVKFLLDKYQAQIPVSRQLLQLASIGLPVAKSTIHAGFRKLYDYLLPLYEHFLHYLHTTHHLHADETRWRVFEELEGKAKHRWWLWVFASQQVGVVVFVLDPSRSAKVPKKHLAEPLPDGQTEAEGQQVNLIDGQAYALAPNLEIISADRLRVYQAISELVKVAFCWAHLPLASGSRGVVVNGPCVSAMGK